MTKSEIIELANELTERKAEKILNLPLLFTHVIQDFCGRNRFWWRRMSVSFSTVLNTRTYDFTNATTFPSLTEINVEEIVKLVIVEATNPIKTTELVPVFDDQTLIEMQQNTQSGKPGRYTIDSNGNTVLRLDLPDGVYSMVLTFWAMPNPGTDTAVNTVPLVPVPHHKALVMGMEYRIWKSIYGPTDPKVVSAKDDYENAILLAQARPRFTTNFQQQLTATESAIRST